MPIRNAWRTMPPGPSSKPRSWAKTDLTYALARPWEFECSTLRCRLRKAPCVWTVFIAAPADGRQKFSEVMRGMLQAATPYFGETTHGLQIYEVPAGRVTIGNPEVVH